MLKRKLFIMLFMVFAISFPTPCIADEQPMTKPVWEEFCPEKYLDIKVLTKEEYDAKFKSLISVSKKKLAEYNETAQYWVERKAHFDKFVDVCMAMPFQSQSVCFMKVRDSEFNANRDFHIAQQDKINEQGAMNARMQNTQMMMINTQMRRFNPMY